MHTWDWIFLAVAVLVLLSYGRPESGRSLVVGKEYEALGFVALLGSLIIIDQVVVGHSWWLYLVGAVLLAVAVLTLLIVASASETPDIVSDLSDEEIERHGI